MGPGEPESKPSTSHRELSIQFLHLLDDPAILQFAIGEHGCPRESLLSDLRRLSGNFLPDVVPIGMIKGISGLGKFAVMDAEG